MTEARPTAQAINIGPKSAALLSEIGIGTLDDLRACGSVQAYARLKFLHPAKVSKNLLWALHAALQNRRWNDLSDAEKAELEAELSAAG